MGTMTKPFPQAPYQTETRILDVRYVGKIKQRVTGKEVAYGWLNGHWNASFPKAVLYEFFGVPLRPDEATTLYQMLGLSKWATASDIKSAWKRLARQWHPDTCKEPDAASQFRAIKEAFDILSDEGKRARYDAGLCLQATVKWVPPLQSTQPSADPFDVAMNQAKEWAPPLRCGYIMCEGMVLNGDWMEVSKIHSWQDIIRADGKVLVSSWPAGAKKPTEEWVTA